MSAHAVERFEDDVLLAVDKAVQSRHFAGDQHGRGELREFEQRELFRMLTQGCRAVEHLRAFGGGAFEQPGAGQIVKVEGWILAHDDGSKVTQPHVMAQNFPVPRSIVVRQFQMPRLGTDAVQRGVMESGLLDGPYRVSGRLGGAHHGNARILGNLQGIQWIKDEGEAHVPNFPGLSARFPALPPDEPDGQRRRRRRNGSAGRRVSDGCRAGSNWFQRPAARSACPVR